VLTHKYDNGMLSVLRHVRSDRKRALSALQNEESSKVVVGIYGITRRSHYGRR